MLNELLAEFKAKRDEQDALSAALAASKKRTGELEHSIIEAMKAAGFAADGDKVSHGGVTVTMRHKWRAAYDPEKWSGIVKWAAETGREYIIQRRLSDKPVLELMDNGVALPDGLTVTSYEDIDFRRS